MSAEPAGEAQRLDRLIDVLDGSEERVRASLASRRGVSGRFVVGRLASFAAGVFAFFATVAFADDRWAWYGTLPSIALFILLVKLHRPIKREIARLERLLALIAAKRGRIAESDVPPVADASLRAPAPSPSAGKIWSLSPEVCEDIALFDGRRHLFGIVSGACSSRLGRLEIARRLVHSSLDPDRIGARSGAARALLAATRTRHRLEQAFATVGDGPGDTALEFAASGDLHLPDEGRTMLLRLITTANVGFLLAATFLEWNPGLLALTVLGLVGSRLFRRTLARTVPVREGFQSLRSSLECCRAVHVILADGTELDGGDELDSIRADIAELDRGGPGLEHALKKLSALDLYKVGLPYVVFNWITFWDLHHLIPLARFGRERREALLAGLEALARLEAATALASLAEEQRGWTWPEARAAERPHLELEAVRHPALKAAAAVSNSIRLEGGRGVCVLTGSNMTGKSTFLKACGSALLTAQAGGPVAAEAMAWTPLRLLSDVNVRDSLDDGRSYFAVEVGRIGEVVALATTEPYMFALLDEMFRGTNTHEKVAAGIEVTRWLAENETLALVATHDHELTALANELPQAGIRNYHFTESLDGGTMTFDYVLRDGPATSRNAIRVLELQGFPEALVKRALSRSEEHGRDE